MTTYLLDWAGLLVRWLHVIAGIAWIGASFYFVWLDNHLRPAAAGAPDPGIAGELWAVHGGGFYRSQKYRVAPAVLPQTLHWFYWEAYTTWLSGFTLLTLLYFFRAEAYLIDPEVLPLSKSLAVSIAVAALVGSWVAYDVLCRSALGRRPALLTALLALSIAVLAWALCQLFSGRGAFMVFGSALGTLMVANVLFVIIPGQRELVRAKQAGREPDAAPGLRGKQRSVHNTYFTLPVVFVMISNHYAMTYGARYNWLVLIAMSVAGACIRAWFVARHRPQSGGVRAAAPAVIGILTLVAVIFALSPWTLGNTARSTASATVSTRVPVDREQVRHIIEERCVPCHASTPTQPGFNAPPNGLMFETMDQVSAHLLQMQQQLAARAMPLGNLTHMTDDERSVLLAWIGRGGPPVSVPYPRDLVGYGRDPPHARWPGAARIALQFVLNFEEGAENNVLHGDAGSEVFLSEIINAASFPMRHMSMESLYEYGSRAGLWRVLRAFERHSLPLTIFAVAEAVRRHAEAAAAFKQLGHEIACHGLRWISYQQIDEATERAHLEEAMTILRDEFGAAPLGWYTGRDSPQTRRLVVEHGGLLYDSDSYADDLPYWTEVPVGDGTSRHAVPHLIVPYALDSNDMRFATAQGFNSGTQFFDYLRAAFDVLYAEGDPAGLDRPKMLSVGLHCRLAGRPGRIAALERFLDYVLQHDKVWICRRADIARHWIATHPYAKPATSVPP